MSVLPSFAERKRVWVFRRCTLSLVITHRIFFCTGVLFSSPKFSEMSSVSFDIIVQTQVASNHLFFGI